MAKKHRSKKKGVADSETDPAAAGTAEAAAAGLADAKPVDTIDWGALKADILAGSDGGEGTGLAAGKKGKREKRVTDKKMNERGFFCCFVLSVCLFAS